MASLEPALQGAPWPHAHLSHISPSHYIKDIIPLVLCLWGKPRGEADQAATKLVPGTARSPALQRHSYAWDPSGHMEILEGSTHRDMERICPCLRLNAAADERPHYTCRSWDTYMTKSTRQSIRDELKQHAESSHPPRL